MLDCWVFGKECIYLGLHVIMRGNDVAEVFDDAEAEIGFRCRSDK